MLCYQIPMSTAPNLPTFNVTNAELVGESLCVNPREICCDLLVVAVKCAKTVEDVRKIQKADGYG